MIKKWIRQILVPYKTASLEIQKKARIVLIIDIILLFFLLFVVFLQIVTKNKNYFLIIGVSFFAAFILSLCIFFLKSGKYTYASNINLAISFLALYAAIFLQANEQISDLYETAFLLNAVLLESCLIGYSIMQTIVITCADIIGLFIVFFVLVLKHEPVSAFNIEAIASTSIITCICGVFASFVLSVTKKVIHYAESEAEKNRKRFEALEKLLVSSGEGFRIGEDLMNISGEISSVIQKINLELTNVLQEIDNLSSNLDESRQINNLVVTTKTNVKDRVGAQHSIITDSAASIEGMVASINSMSQLSLEKKESINILVNMARDGVVHMDSGVRFIDGIAKSSENILDLIDVISSVASKTNLLSMNAAIEAAHAEDAGRGFSVVADEIQKLAEETNTSAKDISGKILTSIEDIKKATDINNKVGDRFHKIVEGILTIAAALEEIISGLKEINEDSGHIITSIQSMKDISRNLDESMNKMEKSITQSDSHLESIISVFNKTREEITRVVDSFTDIRNRVNTFSSLGKQNIQYIRFLEQEIKRIKE